MRNRWLIFMSACILAVGMMSGCGDKADSRSDEQEMELTNQKDAINNFAFNEVVIKTDNTHGTLIFEEDEVYLYDAKAEGDTYVAYTQDGRLYISENDSAFESFRADVPSFNTYKSLLDVVTENLSYDNNVYGGSLASADVTNSFSAYMNLLDYDGESLKNDKLSFEITVSNAEIVLLIDDFYSLSYKMDNIDPVEVIKDYIISTADTGLNGIICYDPDLDEEITLNIGNLCVSDDFVLQIRVVDGQEEKFIDVADIEILEEEVKISGKSYLLTNRLGYQKRQEAEKEAEKISNAKYWKDAYIGYFNAIDFPYKDFVLVDVLEDGIPEFLYKTDGKYGMCYVDADYVVHDLEKLGNISFFDPFNENISDSIVVTDATDYSKIRGFDCSIFYYNRSTGKWDTAFVGTVSNGWWADGVEVEASAYENRIYELAPWQSWRTLLGQTVYHTESVAEYIESYEVK